MGRFRVQVCGRVGLFVGVGVGLVAWGDSRREWKGGLCIPLVLLLKLLL